MDSMENKPESLLVVSLGKALNGMLAIFMWQTGGPPDYNCEVANPACRKAIRLVGGGVVSHL